MECCYDCYHSVFLICEERHFYIPKVRKPRERGDLGSEATTHFCKNPGNYRILAAERLGQQAKNITGRARQAKNHRSHRCEYGTHIHPRESD